jgi:peroxiredoxin Q/BCP
MIGVGDSFPPVRVKDQHGRDRSIADFAGRRVVIWWFPKADTPGCTAEGCGFRDLQAEYAKKGVAILGASFDTPAENLAFAAKHQYAFDILCDTTRTLGVALGLAEDANAPYAKRWTYVVGPDGKVEQKIESVSPRSHPADLLKTLP